MANDLQFGGIYRGPLVFIFRICGPYFRIYFFAWLQLPKTRRPKTVPIWYSILGARCISRSLVGAMIAIEKHSRGDKTYTSDH